MADPIEIRVSLNTEKASESLKAFAEKVKNTLENLFKGVSGSEMVSAIDGLGNAIKNLPDAANLKNIASGLRSIHNSLKQLSEPDISPATTKINELKSALQGIPNNIRIRIGVDTPGKDIPSPITGLSPTPRQATLPDVDRQREADAVARADRQAQRQGEAEFAAATARGLRQAEAAQTIATNQAKLQSLEVYTQKVKLLKEQELRDEKRKLDEELRLLREHLQQAGNDRAKAEKIQSVIGVVGQRQAIVEGQLKTVEREAATSTRVVSQALRVQDEKEYTQLVKNLTNEQLQSEINFYQKRVQESKLALSQIVNDEKLAAQEREKLTQAQTRLTQAQSTQQRLAQQQAQTGVRAEAIAARGGGLISQRGQTLNEVEAEFRAANNRMVQLQAETSNRMRTLGNVAFVGMTSGIPVVRELGQVLAGAAFGATALSGAITAGIGVAVVSAVHLATFAARTLFAVIKDGIETSAHFQERQLAIQALLAQNFVFAKNVTENFNKAGVAAGSVFQQLLKLAPQTIGGIDQLSKALQATIASGAAFGVSIKDAIQLSPLLVNTVSLITGKFNDQRQILTEINALFQGQARAGAEVIRILIAQNPFFKEQFRLAQEQGKVTAFLKEQLSGIEAASKALGGTWTGLLTTLESMKALFVTRVFDQFFKDLIKLLQDTISFLDKNKDKVNELAGAAKIALREMVAGFSEVGIAVKLLTGRDALGLISDIILLIAAQWRVFTNEFSTSIQIIRHQMNALAATAKGDLVTAAKESALALGLALSLALKGTFSPATVIETFRALKEDAKKTAREISDEEKKIEKEGLDVAQRAARPETLIPGKKLKDATVAEYDAALKKLGEVQKEIKAREEGITDLGTKLGLVKEVKNIEEVDKALDKLIKNTSGSVKKADQEAAVELKKLLDMPKRMLVASGRDLRTEETTAVIGRKDAEEDAKSVDKLITKVSEARDKAIRKIETEANRRQAIVDAIGKQETAEEALRQAEDRYNESLAREGLAIESNTEKRKADLTGKLATAEEKEKAAKKSLEAAESSPVGEKKLAEERAAMDVAKANVLKIKTAIKDLNEKDRLAQVASLKVADDYEAAKEKTRLTLLELEAITTAIGDNEHNQIIVQRIILQTQLEKLRVAEKTRQVEFERAAGTPGFNLDFVKKAGIALEAATAARVEKEIGLRKFEAAEVKKTNDAILSADRYLAQESARITGDSLAIRITSIEESIKRELALLDKAKQEVVNRLKSLAAERAKSLAGTALRLLPGMPKLTGEEQDAENKADEQREKAKAEGERQLNAIDKQGKETGKLGEALKRIANAQFIARDATAAHTMAIQELNTQQEILNIKFNSGEVSARNFNKITEEIRQARLEEIKIEKAQIFIAISRLGGQKEESEQIRKLVADWEALHRAQQKLEAGPATPQPASIFGPGRRAIAGSETASSILNITTEITGSLSQIGGAFQKSIMSGIGTTMRNVGLLLAAAGHPIVAAVVIAVGEVVSFIDQFIGRSAKKLAEQIRKELAGIQRDLQFENVDLSGTIARLEAERARAISDLGRKKRGRKQLDVLLPEIDQQLDNLRLRQKAILQRFETDLGYLRLDRNIRTIGQAFHDLGERIKEFLGAGGQAATAFEFLTRSSEDARKTIQESMDEALKAFLKGAEDDQGRLISLEQRALLDIHESEKKFFDAKLKRDQQISEIEKDLIKNRIDEAKKIFDIETEGIAIRVKSTIQSKQDRIAEIQNQAKEQRDQLERRLKDLQREDAEAAINHANELERIKNRLARATEEHEKRMAQLRQQYAFITEQEESLRRRFFPGGPPQPPSPQPPGPGGGWTEGDRTEGRRQHDEVMTQSKTQTETQQQQRDLQKQLAEQSRQQLEALMKISQILQEQRVTTMGDGQGRRPVTGPGGPINIVINTSGGSPQEIADTVRRTLSDWTERYRVF